VTTVEYTEGKYAGYKAVVINPDDLLAEFGVDAIGVVSAGVNPETHAIFANITNNDKVWALFKAEATEKRTYEESDWSDYIDIGFVSTLLSDITKTMTNDNGEIYTLYTFACTANIELNLASIITETITINILSLTVGLDENGEMYVTILAHLNKLEKVTTIVTERDISITVSVHNGTPYITLGRDFGTQKEQYRIMTLEYFIDNIFDADDSPIKWLTSTDKTLWSSIANALSKNVSLSSGLTTPDSIDLTASNGSEEETSTLFSLSSYINAFVAMANNEELSAYGNASTAVSALDLNNVSEGNYYAFDVNVSNIKAITALYAALLRNDEQGINGFAAYGNVQDGLVKFNLSLNKYLEGVDFYYGDNVILYDKAKIENADSFDTQNNTYYVEENGEYTQVSTYEEGKTYYTSHTARITECAGRNYLAYVLDTFLDGSDEVLTAEGEYDSVNNYNRIFGMYESDTTGGTTGKHTVYSNELNKVEVHIYDEEENPVYEGFVKYSSTITLTENAMNYVEDESGNFYAYELNGTTRVTENTITIDNNKVVNDEVVLNYRLYHTFDVTFVAVNLDVDGVTISVVENDAITLPTQFADNYALVGSWYTDSDCTAGNEISTYIYGTQTVYATLAEKLVTDEQGIQYTFVATAEGGEYKVSGFDKSKGYTSIVIANEVDGFKVVEIANEAFKEKGLKNVEVPENVTYIGNRAFLDNYGLEKVVFRAETITFADTTASSKNGPFYGCSESESGYTTALVVYYNKITNTGDDWKSFRYKNNTYNIGSCGGATYGNGTWAEVTFVVEGYEADLGLTNGITTEVLTTSDVENAINEITAASYNYINGYTVTFDKPVELNAQKYTVTITVTENDTRYYLIDKSVDDRIIITGDKVVYDKATQSYYAETGSIVTVTPPEGYEFDGFSVTNSTYEKSADSYSDDYIVTVGNGKLTIAATFVPATIKRVTIVSEVSFTYNNVTYEAGNTTLDVLGVDQLFEGNPVTSDGYYFVGWAYNNGTSLEFTTSTIQYKTYYAIWAVARDEFSGVTVVTEGTDPTAATPVPKEEGVEGTFYMWYLASDENFTGSPVTQITTTSTVLRARMQYTLAVTATGTNSKNTTMEIKVGSKTSTGYSKSQTASATYVVFEKEQLYIQDTDALAGKTANCVYALGRVDTSLGTEVLASEIRIKVSNSTKTINTKINNESFSVSATSDDNFKNYFTVTGNTTINFNN
jgi:hypothetical protein